MRPVRSLSSRRTGAHKGGEGIAGSQKGGTLESGLCLVCPPGFGRAHPVLFSERQVASDKGEADSSLLPESKGSAQLWTAGLLSVCLSPRKSTPLPSLFSLCLISSSLQVTVPINDLAVASYMKMNCAKPLKIFRRPEHEMYHGIPWHNHNNKSIGIG